MEHGKAIMIGALGFIAALLLYFGQESRGERGPVVGSIAVLLPPYLCAALLTDFFAADATWKFAAVIYAIALAASLLATVIGWKVMFGGSSGAFIVNTMKLPAILGGRTLISLEEIKATEATPTRYDGAIEFHQRTMALLVLGLAIAYLFWFGRWLIAALR